MRLALAGIFAILAFNAKAETLVVAAPFSEFPALAAQMQDGAEAALMGAWTIQTIDAGCTETNAAAAANLIIAEKPDAVIGLPCIESLTPVLAALGPIGVPVITVASRAEAPSKLAVKNQWRLYRTGPRERQEVDEIAKLVVEAWRDVPFALLDDGTIFARDTAEAIRNEAETTGKKPLLVDGFQPQLENQKKLIDRLVAAGATHVFIASDRANIAQIANEAAGTGLIIAGPETLKANDLDFVLPAGVLMAARHISFNQTAITKVITGQQNPFALADGYVADAYVAAEIAMALKIDPTLRSIETAAGSMTIADDGFIEPIEFSFFRFDGVSFQKVKP